MNAATLAQSYLIKAVNATLKLGQMLAKK